MATDPVCKMRVDEASARFKHAHNGATYYFCSEGCMKSFRADPSKYVK
jgi:Cu+-exporting ATPase